MKASTAKSKATAKKAVIEANRIEKARIPKMLCEHIVEITERK